MEVPSAAALVQHGQGQRELEDAQQRQQRVLSGDGLPVGCADGNADPGLGERCRELFQILFEAPGAGTAGRQEQYPHVKQ